MTGGGVNCYRGHVEADSECEGDVELLELLNGSKIHTARCDCGAEKRFAFKPDWWVCGTCRVYSHPGLEWNWTFRA